MSESIVIEVENRSELEALAHSKGYDTVQDYVLALIAVDSEADDLSRTVSRGLARSCSRT